MIMTTGTELARVESRDVGHYQHHAAPPPLDEGKTALLKRTICKGATNDELELFIHACNRFGLDPFMRQIHAVKRWQDGQEVMTIQTGIDGYRLIADRTGKYMPGQKPSFRYDEDGHLVSATAYVKRLGPDGEWHVIDAEAFYDEYCGRKKGGEPNHMWSTKAHIMLSKCAEALCLRKAFPAEMSGIYTREEMDQADNEGTAAPRQARARVVNADDQRDQEEQFLAEWDFAVVLRGADVDTGREVLAKTRGNRTIATHAKWHEEALKAMAAGKFDKGLKIVNEDEKPEPPQEQDAESPLPDVSTYENFIGAAQDVGLLQTLDEASSRVLADRWLMRLSAKGKEFAKKTTEAQRREWLAAFAEKRIDPETGSIVAKA